MPKLDKNIQVNQDRESLIYKCIQQILVDLIDNVTMNYFETSASYLVELFGNRKLYIFALNEDDANKELNVDFFVLNLAIQSKAKHHYTRIKPLDTQSFDWLYKRSEASFSMHKPDELKFLFDIDFGIKPVIIHHLWLNNRIVGGVCYEEPAKDCEDFTPITSILNVLTIQFFQRQQRIEIEDKIKNYQQVLNLIPQRVFWKNKKSIYVGVNEAFAHDAGLTKPEEIIGKDDYAIFPTEANDYRLDDALNSN